MFLKINEEMKQRLIKLCCRKNGYIHSNRDTKSFIKNNDAELYDYLCGIVDLTEYNDNIKEVICKDMKEHFFDKIIVTDKENRIIKIYDNGLTETTFDKLTFHFTCDYAKCIANMEHDLFHQTRKGKHNNYDFIFDKDYIEPILIPLEDIKGLDIYDNL